MAKVGTKSKHSGSDNYVDNHTVNHSVNHIDNNKPKQDTNETSGHKYFIRVVLIAVFFLVLIVRLYFAFSTPNFTGNESYFVIRQVESIRETGFPLFGDELSYGGRYYLFLPVFHYILALFSFVMPIAVVCKFVPNLFAATGIFGVFLLVRYITKNDEIALFTAFISGFVPIYFSETVNSVSVYSITIPITIFLLYFFLRINIKKSPGYFVLLLLLLIMLDFSSYIVIFAICLYLIFSWTEGFSAGRAEIELALFSVFLMVFIYVTVFREAFIIHGYKFILNNVPATLLQNYFSQVNILEAVYAIGLIPAVCGIIVILVQLFRKKKSVYLPISLSIVLGIMLALKLVPLKLGLMMLGIIFVILFGETLSFIIGYVRRTKFTWAEIFVYSILLLIFIATSVVPSVAYTHNSLQNAVSDEDIAALEKVRLITGSTDTIVAPIYEGHLISYFTERKNIADTNFLSRTDSEERLADLRLIYNSANPSKVIEIMDKYSAEYILFDKAAMDFYNITDLSYVDIYCFPAVLRGEDITLYEKKCTLNSIKS